MPSYRLKGKRVVVKAEPPGERIGSIIIPERARQQPLVGTVVLVGDRVTEVSVGDRVMFPSRAWSRFNAEGYGFPHMLLKEDDLMVVMDPLEVFRGE
jgi:co-chaperonin GroES (HSP10)